MAFDIFRNGSRIRGHTLDFTLASERLVVSIDIKIAVAVGPITVFRYTMAGEEIWQGSRFDIATHTPTQDWHDPDQIWVGLGAKIRDGSVTEYRRLG